MPSLDNLDVVTGGFEKKSRKRGGKMDDIQNK